MPDLAAHPGFRDLLDLIERVDQAVSAELAIARAACGRRLGVGEWTRPDPDRPGYVADERGRTITDPEITTSSTGDHARHMIAQSPAATIRRCEHSMRLLSEAREALWMLAGRDPDSYDETDQVIVAVTVGTVTVTALHYDVQPAHISTGDPS